jgi:hypothetical protein
VRDFTAGIKVGAQVSIYPLRQKRLTPAIEAVTAALEAQWI